MIPEAAPSSPRNYTAWCNIGLPTLGHSKAVVQQYNKIVAKENLNTQKCMSLSPKKNKECQLLADCIQVYIVRPIGGVLNVF